MDSNQKQSFWKDKTSDAVLYQSNIHEGDIVICATDGLFDNLYINEITRIVEVFMSELNGHASDNSIPTINSFSDTPDFSDHHTNLLTRRQCKKLAQELVKEAYRKSKSRTCLTPFGDKFDKTGLKKDNERLKWKGGKPDDICAVVGILKRCDSQPLNI